jgi:hypothetical protein
MSRIQKFLDLGALIVASWRALSAEEVSAEVSRPSGFRLEAPAPEEHFSEAEAEEEEEGFSEEAPGPAWARLDSLKAEAEAWAVRTAREARENLPYEFRGAVETKLSELRRILGNG